MLSIALVYVCACVYVCMYVHMYVCIVSLLCIIQDILRLLFGKDVKDVDVDMVVKKRNEFMADRGKKVCTCTCTL